MKEKTIPARKENASGEMPQATPTREESRTLMPPVDIFEVDDSLAVVVDLPGVSKDGVSIDVNNNILTIKGTVQDTEEGEPLYREFRLRNFFRQFELSEQIDQDNIKADMKHGVLTIRLPKVEKAKPRKISVEVVG
jgi:HSP20 family protein